ncbi:MAG: prolipoprotein diacylglyceryl transferase [Spirochaetales bacterium]|nr:prolipoprotein diacylglyceryl transferase [Spirochaetales bacterium]
MLHYITFPDWIKPEIIPGITFIRWYALMYIIAFGITYLLFRYQIKERKLQIKEDDIYNVFFWGIVGLIIGARLFAVTVYDRHGEFLKNPIIAFLPVSCENGGCQFTGFAGMSYHGGVIGCIIGVLIYTKIKKIDILEWGDLIVAGIPLGYTFGRLGNFINGELYGRVTTLPWGMVFPDARAKLPADDSWVKATAEKLGIEIPPSGMVNLPRHPSQLYEALFEGIVLWLAIWFLFRKRKPFKGFIIGTYIIGYGLIRFFIEYVREPDIGKFLFPFGEGKNAIYRLVSPWNFTLGQLLCFLMIIGGIASLLIFRHLSKRQELEAAEAKEKPDLKKLRKKIK